MGGGDQRLQPAAAPSPSPSSGYPPRESLEGRIFGGVEDALKYMFMPQGMVETPENQSPGLAGLLAHAFDPQTYVDQLSQSAQTIRQDPTSREAFRDYALAAGMLAPGVPKGMRAFQEATGGERLVAASEWGSAMRSGGKEPPPPGAGAERVTEATQRAPDGKIFKGWDHLDATLKAEEAGYNIESLEAGFATNKRPFLDREEAFRVAKKEIPSLRPHEDFTNPSLGAENLAQARKAAPQMTSNYHASLDQHLNENYGWRLMTDQEAPGRQKIIDANGRDIAHFAGGVKGDKLILSNVEALADPATKQTAKGLGLVDKIFQHAAQFTKENGLEVYTSARTSPITEAKYQKYFVEPFAPEIHAPSGRSVGAEPTTGGIPSREEIGISSGAEPPPPGAGAAFAPYADEILKSVNYVDKPEARLARDAAGLYEPKLREINLPTKPEHNPYAVEFVRAHEQAHHVWSGLQNATAAELMRQNPAAFTAFKETSAGKSQIIRHKIKGEWLDDPSGFDWIEAVPDLYAEMKVKGIRNPELEAWLENAIPEANKPPPPGAGIEQAGGQGVKAGMQPQFKRLPSGDYDVIVNGEKVGLVERGSSWDPHHRGPSAGGAGYDASVSLGGKTFKTSSQLFGDVKSAIRQHFKPAEPISGPSGEPITFYHGSGQAGIKAGELRSPIYLTPDIEHARGFSEQSGVFDEPLSGRLELKNPKVVNITEEQFKSGNYQLSAESSFVSPDKMKSLQKQGYDGIVAPLPDGSVHEAVAFDAAQIKPKWSEAQVSKDLERQFREQFYESEKYDSARHKAEYDKLLKESGWTPNEISALSNKEFDQFVAKAKQDALRTVP